MASSDVFLRQLRAESTVSYLPQTALLCGVYHTVVQTERAGGTLQMCQDAVAMVCGILCCVGSVWH